MGPQPAGEPGRRRPNPWHQATAAAERIPYHLDQPDDQASQAHIAAFGEALDALPLVAPQALRPQLRESATAFERATRSLIQAEHHHPRALRGAVRGMLRQHVSNANGAALAMFLDAAILVVIAAARWHQLRHHDQQVAATHQALIHLQAAYDQAATEPLAALAQRRPPQQTVDRHIHVIRRSVPEHTEQVLDDPAFEALTATLAEAETAGHDPQLLLQQAANQRALDDARHPARVLTWRIQRLSARPASSARARAAQASSAAPRSSEPVQAATTAPPSQTPRARRR